MPFFLDVLYNFPFLVVWLLPSHFLCHGSKVTALSPRSLRKVKGLRDEQNQKQSQLL